MARDPKTQPGDHTQGEAGRGGSPDTAEFPIGGAVLSGRREDADDPMTREQAAELRQICEEKDEVYDGNLTREQADARIAALKQG